MTTTTKESIERALAEARGMQQRQLLLKQMWKLADRNPPATDRQRLHKPQPAYATAHDQRN